MCVRLATYESQYEADVLLGVFRGRSGQLENTTFALMDPGGTRVLGQAGRGPAFLVGGARGPGQATSAAEVARFAARLNEVAGQYKPRAEITALPQALDVRRALVVAACDGQAVLVVRIQDAKQRDAVTKALAALVWRDDLRGRFQVQVARPDEELPALEGLGTKQGVFLVKPGAFGIDGEVLASVAPQAPASSLEALARRAVREDHASPTDRRRHIQAGRAAGATWESEIPVTDPGAQQARERGR